MWEWATYATSGPLCLAFAYQLTLLLTKEPKINFLRWLDVLVLFTNIGACVEVYVYTDDLITVTSTDPGTWDIDLLKRRAWLAAAFTWIRDVGFIMSHWLFAMKYWSLSREVSLLFKGEDVVNTISCNTFILWFGLLF